MDAFVDRGLRPSLLAGHGGTADLIGAVEGLRLPACGSIPQTDDSRLRRLPIGQPAFRIQTLGS